MITPSLQHPLPPCSSIAAHSQAQFFSPDRNPNPNLHSDSDSDNASIAPLEVVFCGHSLGAAIASLAAFELAENMKCLLEAFAMEECFNVPKSKALSSLAGVIACPPPRLSLYMYGAPRVGNSQFASAIARKIETIYRVQVNGDLVTMLPKFVGFYRHIGTGVILDDEETGSIVINPTLLETSILRRTTGSIANHSLDKYRSCLEACFEEDELEEYLNKEFENLTSAAEAAAAGPTYSLR
jgi:hypothetical protein